MTNPHPTPRSSPGRPRGSPRPQRAHRNPVTASRSARLSDRHLAALATRLTPRDLWLLAMLYEHQVLTTHAIARIAFSSDHRARRRLLQLHRWDVLERFAPRLPVGAAPMHYVLGPAGAAVLAAHHDLPTRALGYRRDEALAIAHHHTLAHTVAVNDLFAHLIHHTLANRPPFPGSGVGAGGAVWLDCWWSEARCRRHLDYVRPDAYARFTTPAPSGGRVLMFEWFLELDFATSTLDTLAGKLDRYAHLAAATRPRPILIWLPTPAREAHARQRLTRALQTVGPGLVPVATSTAAIAALPRPDLATHGDSAAGMAPGPADQVWLPLPVPPGTGRIGLAELARIWPASPGHTLADEATTPGGTDVDLEPGHGRLPPPHPLSPIPPILMPRSTRGHR
jgi:protein involved in plasmid replication-relaxation